MARHDHRLQYTPEVPIAACKAEAAMGIYNLLRVRGAHLAINGAADKVLVVHRVEVQRRHKVSMPAGSSQISFNLVYHCCAWSHTSVYCRTCIFLYLLLFQARSYFLYPIHIWEALLHR